jgi:type IV secretion system protein VirB6
MADFCPAPDPDLGLVRSLLGSVDCNVQTLAQAGYGVLASPGSPLASAMTILLTLYIAFLGLRLMLGLEPLRVGSMTMTVLKIGAILALATNWPTYQQIVSTTLVKGPEQLGSLILAATQPPSGSLAANPFAGLQAAYDELQRSATFYGGKVAPGASPLLVGVGASTLALSVSSMLLLLQTLAVLLAAKIALAVLLAVGPVFIAMLLFPATRGLFEGWLRAALAFAFVPLLAVMGLVVQLILLEPHLLRLAELRAQNLTDAAEPSAVLLLTLIFAFVTTALLIAVGAIAFGFRLPQGRQATQVVTESDRLGAPITATTAAPAAARNGFDDRPQRAAQIALAAAAMDRRESRDAVFSTPHILYAGAERGGQIDPLAARPPPSSQRRTAPPRRAASSQRRDR